MLEWDRITGEREAVFGLLEGLLAFGGFLAWVFPTAIPAPAGAALLAFGAILLLDDAYPYGKQSHIVSLLGGAVAGVAVSTISFFVPGAFVWPLLMALLISAAKAAAKTYRRYGRERAKTYKP